jgi:hypothetical protein
MKKEKEKDCPLTLNLDKLSPNTPNSGAKTQKTRCHSSMGRKPPV